jgi:hypothetical protein
LLAGWSEPFPGATCTIVNRRVVTVYDNAELDLKVHIGLLPATLAFPL